MGVRNNNIPEQNQFDPRTTSQRLVGMERELKEMHSKNQELRQKALGNVEETLPVEPIDDNVGSKLFNAGWGQSKYDYENGFYDADFQTEMLNDLRGQRQSGMSQIVNALGKSVTTGVASFAQDVIAIGGADTETMNAISDFTDYMEEALPNYRTNDEMNTAWYKKAFDPRYMANFWGDDIVKNYGFTVASMFYGAGLVRGASILPGIGKLMSKSPMAARTIGSLGAAIGESTIETNHFLRDARSTVDENINSAVMLELNNLANLDLTVDEYELAKNDILMKGEQMRQESYERMDDIATAVFGANMAVTFGTDFFGLGKHLFSNGIRKQVQDGTQRLAEQSATDAAKKSVKGKISKLLSESELPDMIRQVDKKYVVDKIGKGAIAFNAAKNVAFEGGQELAQGYFQETGTDYSVPLDPDAYHRALTDPNYEIRSRDFFEAASKATEYFGTEQAWLEAFAGGLMGGTGMVTIGKNNNSGANTWLGRGRMIGLSGGIGGEITMANEKNRLAEVTANAMNKLMDKTESLGDYLTLSGAFSDQSIRAARAGNLEEAMTYRDADIFAGIDAFRRAGKLDFLRAMIGNENDEISDEQIKSIGELAVRQGNTDTEGMSDYFNVDGTLKSDTEEGRKEIRKKISERRKNIQHKIDLYEKAIDYVGHFADGLNEDIKSELAWMKYTTFLFEERIGDIVGQNSKDYQKWHKILEENKKELPDNPTEEQKRYNKVYNAFLNLTKELEAVATEHHEDIPKALLKKLITGKLDLGVIGATMEKADLDFNKKGLTEAEVKQILKDEFEANNTLDGIAHELGFNNREDLYKDDVWNGILDAVSLTRARMTFDARLREVTADPKKFIEERKNRENKQKNIENDLLTIDNLKNSTVSQINKELDKGTMSEKRLKEIMNDPNMPDEVKEKLKKVFATRKKGQAMINHINKNQNINDEEKIAATTLVEKAIYNVEDPKGLDELYYDEDQEGVDADSINAILRATSAYVDKVTQQYEVDDGEVGTYVDQVTHQQEDNNKTVGNIVEGVEGQEVDNEEATNIVEETNIVEKTTGSDGVPKIPSVNDEKANRGKRNQEIKEKENFDKQVNGIATQLVDVLFDDNKTDVKKDFIKEFKRLAGTLYSLRKKIADMTDAGLLNLHSRIKNEFKGYARLANFIIENLNDKKDEPAAFESLNESIYKVLGLLIGKDVNVVSSTDENKQKLSNQEEGSLTIDNSTKNDEEQQKIDFTNNEKTIVRYNERKPDTQSDNTFRPVTSEDTPNDNKYTGLPFHVFASALRANIDKVKAYREGQNDGSSICLDSPKGGITIKELAELFDYQIENNTNWNGYTEKQIDRMKRVYDYLKNKNAFNNAAKIKEDEIVYFYIDESLRDEQGDPIVLMAKKDDNNNPIIVGDMMPLTEWHNTNGFVRSVISEYEKTKTSGFYGGNGVKVISKKRGRIVYGSVSDKIEENSFGVALGNKIFKIAGEPKQINDSLNLQKGQPIVLIDGKPIPFDMPFVSNEGSIGSYVRDIVKRLTDGITSQEEYNKLRAKLGDVISAKSINFIKTRDSVTIELMIWGGENTKTFTTQRTNGEDVANNLLKQLGENKTFRFNFSHNLFYSDEAYKKAVMASALIKRKPAGDWFETQAKTADGEILEVPKRANSKPKSKFVPNREYKIDGVDVHVVIDPKTYINWNPKISATVGDESMDAEEWMRQPDSKERRLALTAIVMAYFYKHKKFKEGEPFNCSAIGCTVSLNFDANKNPYINFYSENNVAESGTQPVAQPAKEKSSTQPVQEVETNKPKDAEESGETKEDEAKIVSMPTTPEPIAAITGTERQYSSIERKLLNACVDNEMREAMIAIFNNKMDKDFLYRIFRNNKSKFTKELVMSIIKNKGGRKMVAPNNVKSKKRDIKKEIEWLKKALPKLLSEDRVRIVNGLIKIKGQDDSLYAFGTFVNGIITISDESALGTLYHEAFHAVVSTLLSDSEYNALFNAAKTKYGNIGTIALEENLAEDFRMYMLINEIPVVRSIANIFRKLGAFINKISGKNELNAIESLFRQINNGDFKVRKEVSKNKSLSREYSANINQYLADRLKYENLTKEQSDFLSESKISKGDYSKLPVDVKERLLECM